MRLRRRMFEFLIAMLMISIVVLSLELFFPMPPPVGPPQPQEPFNGIPDFIEVYSPKPNQVVCGDGSVTVTGRAKGYWYFEATFPVTVVDVHEQPIGEWYAEAQSDWMVSTWVPFKGVIPFREPQGMEGKIVFHKSNASGLPEHDMAYEMPVKFQPKEECK
jgi:immunoglobulin-like protein involved in spore germination